MAAYHLCANADRLTSSRVGDTTVLANDKVLPLPCWNQGGTSLLAWFFVHCWACWTIIKGLDKNWHGLCHSVAQLLSTSRHLGELPSTWSPLLCSSRYGSTWLLALFIEQLMGLSSRSYVCGTSIDIACFIQQLKCWRQLFMVTTFRHFASRLVLTVCISL